MRYLGIDYGQKNIGLALGDSETKIAAPFKVIANRGMDKTLPALLEIIGEEGVEQIVVDITYSLKEKIGKIGQQEKEVLDFVTRLGMATKVPIAKEDERFTSAQVDKMMAGEKLPDGKRDAVSAMLILQSHLDKL
jgi:putative Holliday junction resolvase